MSPSEARPGGTSSALALLYHELRETPAAYSYVLAANEFEKHLALFASLQEAQTHHYQPLITFDDGHLTNHTLALPMLQQRHLKAYFFITAGWTGTRADYMDWPQLRELQAAGHSIGAHGWSHKLLTHCTPSELDRELRGTREALEDGLGIAVTSLSLPGGRANRDVLLACESAGYTTVWTSEPRPETLPLGSSVGRFNIRGDIGVDWLANLLTPESGVLAGVRRTHTIKAALKRIMGDRLYAGLWSVLNRQEPETEPDAAAPNGDRA